MAEVVVATGALQGAEVLATDALGAGVLATGAFGTPVDKDVLVGSGMYPDPSKITQKDLASFAQTMMTADGRDKEALTFVEKLKNDYGNGVSTLFVFYNATGAPLVFAKSHDWSGHRYKIPPPHHLENGQWGAFLHVKTSGAAKGSAGAVVYRGKLNNDTRDWLLCWDVPWGPSSNKVYTQIRGVDHWPKVGSWSYMHSMGLQKSGKYCVEKYLGRRSEISIGNGTSPVVRAILTLL